MRRTVAIPILVAMVSLLGVSDVRGGAAGIPAGKTSGPALTATIVMDLTGNGTPGTGGDPGKGLTSIRIQRAGSSASALFTSGIIFAVPCSTVVGETNFRFEGNMNAWVPQSVRISLFGSEFAETAVITDTDYATCTPVVGGAGGGTRQVLSFSAVIQFEK